MMVHKKPPQKQKNQQRAAASPQQVDTVRLGEELVRYHEIARTLRNCAYDEIEGILAPITSLDEETQIALLKALSKEQTLDAADVVSALNTFAPLKEVRKQARRSLLRLQEARIFPEWTPPSPPSTADDLLTQAIDTLSAGPRRFWAEALCYNDALIAQESPDNRDITVYEQAQRQAVSVMDQQRCAVYLNLIAERFPEKRVEALEALAELYESILEEYDDLELEDLEDIEDEESDANEVLLYKKLLEQAYRDAISAGGGASNYIRLAELLFAQNRSSDEIEDLLHQAQPLTNDTEELASIERGLGNIAMQRKDNEQALKHFLRSAELDPEIEGIWGLIGRAQSRLKRYDEAVANLQRAIEEDPPKPSNYLVLATIYAKQEDAANARETLKEGLEEFPYNSGLAATLSSLYSATGDLANAKRYLELAEKGEDEDAYDEDLLTMARIAYEAKKAEKPSPLGKLKFSRKKKK